MPQLRNHPKMKYRGVPNWPPTFGGGAYSSGMRFPSEEELQDGILEEVQKFHPDHPNSAQRDSLTVFIEYQGKKYDGLLYFDDPTFIDLWYEKLKFYIGRSISEISSLDID
jgi:hypothetical protein